jgi:hypothetical protein
MKLSLTFLKQVLFKLTILAIIIIVGAALQSRANAPVGGIVEAQSEQATTVIPDGLTTGTRRLSRRARSTALTRS